MDPTQQAKIDKVMMEIDKTDNKVHIYLWEY
jgi:enolase